MPKLLVLLVIAAMAIPFLAKAKRPAHDFEGRCSVCHLTLADGRVVFVKDINALCTGCHSDLGLSHPSGLRPSKPLPDQFPLDWAGRMTCATCHEFHGRGKALLRGEQTGRIFCYACHQGSVEQHAGNGWTAHSRKPEGEGFEVIKTGEPLDRVSLECMSCHDNSLGRAPNVKIRAGWGIWNHGDGESHPIGVPYMKAYRKGGLRHPASLDPAVRLFDGRVGCGSCHSIYSKEKFYLVISNRDRGLCYACHKK